MNESIKRIVPEQVLDGIYIALYDAYERLPNGTTNIKRCLNCLEEHFGYLPPKGYNEDNNAVQKT